MSPRASSTLLGLVLVLALAGCDSGPSKAEQGEADSSDDSSDLTCQDHLDEATCESASGSVAGCVWLTLWRTSRTGDSCEVEEVGRCFDQIIYDTAQGCGPAQGCEAEVTPYIDPFYMVEESGTVLLIDMCGGTAPVGYEPCQIADASASDPPECACACELAPNPLP